MEVPVQLLDQATTSAIAGSITVIIFNTLSDAEFMMTVHLELQTLQEM